MKTSFQPLEGGIINTRNLWISNSPDKFWQLVNPIDESLWKEAIQKATAGSNFQDRLDGLNHFLSQTLGEGRYGDNHWKSTTFNRLYWKMKPFIPRVVIKKVRSFVAKNKVKEHQLYWPIDNRFVRFQWETLRQLLLLSGEKTLRFINFWPNRKTFALVLTHDVETQKMHCIIPRIADLEEKFGFRSSFNIVGSQIPENLNMFKELKTRGFEIGIHGWHHNETAFNSRETFRESAQRIEECLETMEAVGIRFPLNLRQPYWMQTLKIEYDLSFFDTDPFEPIPGGAMSIWPFFIGKILELPATLTQDNTLVNLLGEKTPRIWIQKVDFIKKYHGMALLNSHPDYLFDKNVWNIYEEFLERMHNMETCWNALPRETARWWKSRAEGLSTPVNNPGSNFAEAKLKNDLLEICLEE